MIKVSFDFFIDGEEDITEQEVEEIVKDSLDSACALVNNIKVEIEK